MESHTPLLTSILLLIIGARFLGELVKRLGQPAIVGEILAGILLGPAVLDIVRPNDHLAGISELSVFLIVLAAGLEMEFTDVMKALRGRGFITALVDILLPLAGGLLIGLMFWTTPIYAIFLGLCLSITALPVAIRILEGFNLLNSGIARYSIATAILNDIVALLFLGIILDMAGAESAGSLEVVGTALLKSAAGLALFAFLVFLAFRLLIWGGSQTQFIERSIRKIMNLFGREALFGIAIIFVLAFGSISEAIGSHFVIGTFFAGLLISRDVFGTTLYAELENTLHSITDGFLAPIFFAYLGLYFSLDTFASLLFVIVLVIVAIAVKVGAGYFGARWLKMGHYEALGIGIVLNGRGIMELVVANIALQRGFVDQKAFSALVFMGVFTTVITPILFKRQVLPYLELEPETESAIPDEDDDTNHP